VTLGTLRSRCHRGNLLPSLPNISNTLGKVISLATPDQNSVSKRCMMVTPVFVQQMIK
jgi:hypothetical protein